MTKRRKPAVIRYHFVSHSKDPARYFYRLLLLDHPWRTENELKDCTSYTTKFKNVCLSIKEKIEQYEPYLEEVQEAT